MRENERECARESKRTKNHGLYLATRRIKRLSMVLETFHFISFSSFVWFPFCTSRETVLLRTKQPVNNWVNEFCTHSLPALLHEEYLKVFLFAHIRFA